jgi:tetratricopeptide (TPR) repeat protein
MKQLISLLIALAVSLPLQAQEKTGTVSTVVQNTAQDAKGASLRPAVNALVKLLAAKKFPEADQNVGALRKQYEAIFDPQLKHFTFHDQEEFDEFSKTSGGRFEWIDVGYAQCIQIQAYLAAERRDFSAAMVFLKAIEEIAPVSAVSAIETGYILNQIGKSDDGLATYRRALALSERYSSQSNYRAAALRGIGFSLIELKRLDEAERAFLQSLDVEPGNRVALNELAYIRDVRARHE